MNRAFSSPNRILGGAAAWRGAVLANSDEWIHTFTQAEITELEKALVVARRGSLAEVGCAEFPLSGLADKLEGLRATLLRGRGFVLMRGLDPANYSPEEIATIFWGIGTHLGRALPQNAQGHLLGHVKDLGRHAADPDTRIYQTSERQGFHTDSADIVGLLCLECAMEGGRSALASCVTIHDILYEQAPDLLAELFAAFCTDHRGEYRPGTNPYFTAPILNWHAEALSVLYQRSYIESAQRFDSVPPLSDRQVAALDAFDAVADDPAIHLEMQLERGDIQFIHNHQMLHDRTAFRDWPEADRRRHLLRLWLCPADGRALPDCFAERFHSVEPGQRGGVILDGVKPVVSLTT